MNTVRCVCLLLVLALAAGCAAPKGTVLLPPFSSLDSERHAAVNPPFGAPLVAQFGARLNIAGQSAPVQGEVQTTESGGSLALILPHGRTLGICTYRTDTGSASGPNGEIARQPVKMECARAEGMGREAASLLFRTGVAVYRILPALGQRAAPSDLVGKGWSAHFSPMADGLNAVYSEQNGMTMEMYFTEISHL